MTAFPATTWQAASRERLARLAARVDTMPSRTRAALRLGVLHQLSNMIETLDQPGPNPHKRDVTRDIDAMHAELDTLGVARP